MRFALLSLFLACNGDIALVDKECSADEASIYYMDLDGDGFGSSAETTISCEAIEGMVTVAGDCDDTNVMIHPEAAEVCNDLDDNCDDIIDDVGSIEGFLDGDGDGYGDETISVASCDAPPELVQQGGDCDDDNPLIFPNTNERCDDVDWDCDGDPSTGTTGIVACEVLMYEGNTADSHKAGEFDLVTFSEVMNQEGATIVYSADPLPSDLSLYQMVYIFHATNAFTPSEIQVLNSYRSSGGTLLLVGENGQWGSSMLPVYNELLTAFNSDGALLTDSFDPNCDDWLATPQGTHPVLDNVTEIGYAFTSSIDVGSTGIGMVTGESGQWIISDMDGVFLFADSTILMDHCEMPMKDGNKTLIRNLYQYAMD